MNEKILTISIAAYNVEKYLEATLESITLEPEVMQQLEVIIEDDGSTDGTTEIAKRYSMKYPNSSIKKKKKNGGYGATINRSIRIAKGKYFKQLDGDDWFDNNNLSKFIVYLKEIDADFVLTPYRECYENGKIIDIDHFHQIKSEVGGVEQLNRNVNLAMHELTIRTDLLKNNRISITENCFYTDNEYTMLPFLYAKTVSKFDFPIYCYRLGRNGQSVSIAGVKKHYKDSVIVTTKLLNYFFNTAGVKMNEIIEHKINLLTDMVYTYHIVAGSEEARQGLLQFDRMLRENYPTVYKQSYHITKVKALRLSHFSLFNYIRRKVLRTWT